MGPNGAGKTTLFRMITGEEEPDEGQVATDQGHHHRLFQPGCRRDVGLLRRLRRDGRGRPGERGRHRTEADRSRPCRSRPDGRDGCARGALRRGPGPVRRARRLRPRRSCLRGAGGAELLPGDDGRRRRQALGRLEDARGFGPHPPDEPGRDAPRRAVQPSRHREPDLARGVPQELRGRPADDLARPRVHEPHRLQGDRDRLAAHSPPIQATTASTSSSGP